MARNAFWLSVCRIAADVLSFVFFAAVSRTFGPAGIGEYSYAFAIGGFVALLATSGYEEFGIRQYVQLQGERRAAAWRSLLLAQAVQLTLMLGGFALFLLLAGGRHARVSVIVELSIFLTGWGLSRTLYVPAIAAESMSRPALTELACRTAAIVFAFALLALTVPTLPLLLLGFPIGAVALVWLAVRNAAGHGAAVLPGGNWPAALQAARGTAPFFGSETLNQFYARADLLLIAYLLGTRSVGLYATGLKFIETGIVPLVLIGTAAYPLLSDNAGRRCPQFADLSRDFVRTILLLSGWLAIGIAFVVPPLIVPIFGGDFAETRTYLPWFAALAVLKGGEVALYRLLYSVRRQGSYFVSLCVGTVLMVTLNLVLIPRLGMLGAVLAAIASVSAVDVLCACALRREVPLRTLAPLIVRLGLALAASAALALLIQEMVGAGWWVAGAAGVSFPVFGSLVGLLPHPRRSQLFLPDALRPGQLTNR
ncbi:MAG TPA: oligosaccharide flippase family protein [Steroidobacteraceae bacterium]|nr:oligosaccharide flippase family protein [Steroidobacteraceae bacterium]